MQKKITLSFITFMMAILFLFVVQTNGVAQSDTTQLWNVVTTDGNEYVGTIVLQTEKEIKLKTTSIGTITLQLSKIKKMDKVNAKNMVGDEVWLDSPSDGRYFFSPSSYGLRQGEGYYQNAWIFFNQLTYGFTDNFSMGIGTIPLFLFTGSDTPIWLTPKVSIPITEDQFAIGGGALLGTVTGDSGGEYGIVYGTSTFGSRDRNLTVGVGYGYIEDDFADTPAITLSAIIRTGKKGYFITENYILSAGDDTVGLISVGGRRLWGNVALDFGGLRPVGSGFDGWALIPWLGIVISFNK